MTIDDPGAGRRRPAHLSRRSRRRWRSSAAVAVLSAAWLAALPARAATAAVADGVYVLRDSFLPGQQPDGNSVIFAGPDGLVVVDTGRHIAHAQALLDFAAARRQPIVAVVNTHWHLDHLGGNGLLRDSVPGLQVVASTAVAPALTGWLAASRRDMQALVDSGRADAATLAMIRIDIALIDLGPKLLPDLALDGPRRLDLAGRPLEIGLATRAVTAGDLWVFDPRTRTLAVGDLVTLPVPFLDTACTAGWQAALRDIDALPFQRLVPGHGAPMDRAGFATWRRAFEGLLVCAAGTGPASGCAEGWINALGDLLPTAQHGLARGMIGDYFEDPLRAPPAQRDRHC